MQSPIMPPGNLGRAVAGEAFRVTTPIQDREVRRGGPMSSQRGYPVESNLKANGIEVARRRESHGPGWMDVAVEPLFVLMVALCPQGGNHGPRA